MTTLADLKRYVADNAADMADGKADRVILRHVNNALRRVVLAHAWNFYKGRAQIALEVAETGSALAATADSDVLTLAAGSEIFKAKYLSETWDLAITSAPDLLFRLSEINDPKTARLVTGQKWIGTTGSSLAYTWKRSVYPLPTGTRYVRQAQLSASRIDLAYLNPADFDRYKLDQPTDSGEPDSFTIRGDTIEVWPAFAATDTRQTLQLSYDRQPVAYTSASPDGAAVDFEERYMDLVERAIDVEIATHHRSSTTLDPGLALRAFEDRLQIHKAADEGRRPQATTLSLGMGTSRRAAEEFWARRGPAGSDVS